MNMSTKLRKDEGMANETYEQQMRDSDMIFTAVSTSAAKNFKEANEIVVWGYVMDRDVSRAGISHALKRLEKYYADNESQK